MGWSGWPGPIRRLAVLGGFGVLVGLGLASLDAARPPAPIDLRGGPPQTPRASRAARTARIAVVVGPPSAPSSTCTNASVVATWSLARQASQVLMLSVPSDQVATVRALVGSGVGGMLVTGSTAPPGLATALAALRAAGGAVPPLFAVDEEGGRVQRLAGALPSLASARQQASSMTTAQVEDSAARVGAALHAIGIGMDFAPDADLDGGPFGRAIGDRSFSADVGRASAYATAFAKGMERAGVVPVAKHFPGHGHANGDTDFSPAKTPPIGQMRAADLRPFAALVAAGIPAVMVGHLDVPGLTEQGRPASLSPAAIGLLRNELGFRGLVVTDSLSMGAISGDGLSVPQAAVAALEAGADLVLFTSNGDAPPTVGAIGAAVTSGALPLVRLQEAVGRVLAVKQIDLCQPHS